MNKICDFYEILNGVTFKPNDKRDPSEGIPLLRANNIKNDKINFEDIYYIDKSIVKLQNLLKKNDVIICASSGSKSLVGKAAIIDKDYQATFGSFCKVLRIKEKYSKNVCFYNQYFFSNEYRKNISLVSKGSNINNLKSSDLLNLNIKVNVKSNLEKLSFIITQLRKMIELKTVLFSKLDQLIKSRFNEMFENLECPIKRIDDVCKLKSGTTLKPEFELDAGEYLYAKVSDMNLSGNEKFMIKSKKYLSKEVGDKYFIPKGSVIFPKRGGAIGTNKKRILMADTCVDLNTMGVIPSKSLNTNYLYQFFQNLDLSTLCDGSTIPQLNNKNIGPLMIKIPPVELQNEFSKFVKLIDKSKFIVQKQIDTLKELLNAKMEEYFG